jgi:hypothetical protein
MKKLSNFWKIFLITFFVTMVLSFISHWWWIGVTVSCITSIFLYDKSKKNALWANFLALFCLWIIVSLTIDIQNEFILSPKIATLFFKTPSVFLLTLVVGIIGGISGLVGGGIGWVMKQIM